MIDKENDDLPSRFEDADPRDSVGPSLLELVGRSRSYSSRKTVKVPLVRSRLYAEIDVRDFELVSCHRWRKHPDKSTNYAVTTIKEPNGDRKTVYLHRLVTGAPDGVPVMHRPDPNGLNCQRSNLEIGTTRKNVRNNRPHRNRPYKGVYQRRNGTWYATIQNQSIGTFPTQVEAAIAWNKEAIARGWTWQDINAIPRDELPVEVLDSITGFRTPEWLVTK